MAKVGDNVIKKVSLLLFFLSLLYSPSAKAHVRVHATGLFHCVCAAGDENDGQFDTQGRRPGVTRGWGWVGRAHAMRTCTHTNRIEAIVCMQRHGNGVSAFVCLEIIPFWQFAFGCAANEYNFQIECHGHNNKITHFVCGVAKREKLHHCSAPYPFATPKPPSHPPQMKNDFNLRSTLMLAYMEHFVSSFSSSMVVPFGTRKRCQVFVRNERRTNSEPQNAMCIYRRMVVGGAGTRK